MVKNPRDMNRNHPHDILLYFCVSGASTSIDSHLYTTTALFTLVCGEAYRQSDLPLPGFQGSATATASRRAKAKLTSLLQFPAIQRQANRANTSDIPLFSAAGPSSPFLHFFRSPLPYLKAIAASKAVVGVAFLRRTLHPSTVCSVLHN